MGWWRTQTSKPKTTFNDRPRDIRAAQIKEQTMSKQWPLWEVFIRSQHGLAHKHVGSLHASDAEMAVNNARDVYTRRNEGVGIWVVRASDIVSSSPGDKAPLFDPSNSKVYRHPTFFPMPEEVKNL
jgi:ring-1,2-phenylacetyl-CoA epoxidase subunit PaaB